MPSNKNIKKGSFSSIKKNLDSSKSYIIFENDLKKEKHSLFSDDIIAYRYLEKENCSFKQIIDRDLSREYLVIQIDPGNEDEFFSKVMGYGFPKNTIYYLFKANKKTGN